MPVVGLGCYSLDKVEMIVNGIVHAGYRHLDTAHFYKNEDIVGEAIKVAEKNHDIQRKDLFVTTKIW